MLLEKIKLSLRIFDDIFDPEIEDLIEAALSNLETSGIKNINISDPQIIRAVTLYCKANFGFNNNESEQFQNCYINLVKHLATSSKYNKKVEVQNENCNNYK